MRRNSILAGFGLAGLLWLVQAAASEWTALHLHSYDEGLDYEYDWRRNDP